MLARRRRRSSAQLRDLRVRLGGVQLKLERGARSLRDDAERLRGGEVALACLLGGVGRCRQALEALGRRGIGERLDLPGLRLVGVLAELPVGAGGGDGDVGARLLRERDVALPGRRHQRQLLLAGCWEGAGGGAVVAALPGRGPAGLYERRPRGCVAGVQPGGPQRRLLLLADDLMLSAAGAAAGEGVEDAAEAVAGADAE